MSEAIFHHYSDAFGASWADVTWPTGIDHGNASGIRSVGQKHPQCMGVNANGTRCNNINRRIGMQWVSSPFPYMVKGIDGWAEIQPGMWTLRVKGADFAPALRFRCHLHQTKEGK